MKIVTTQKAKPTKELKLATRSILLTTQILNYCAGEFELPLEFQEEVQALIEEHNRESDQIRASAVHIDIRTNGNRKWKPTPMEIRR